MIFIFFANSFGRARLTALKARVVKVIVVVVESILTMEPAIRDGVWNLTHEIILHNGMKNYES